VTGRRRALPRRFFAGDPLDLAPLLLGKILAAGDRAGRIVEVEAYHGEQDPASHAYRGRTPRNATMFGPPGHLYVYFTYGMHYCANVVCGPVGVPGAVLLRALEPLGDLGGSSGPALLCRALGIDRSFDGADLVKNDRGVRLLDDGFVVDSIGTSARIGLSARVGDAAAWPWRFFVPTSPFLSRRAGAWRSSPATAGAAPPP
jgi:DNA-3-methyladenine glycosylase